MYILLNAMPVYKISARKLELCHRTLQNVFPKAFSHSMSTGWAKNGTVVAFLQVFLVKTLTNKTTLKM